MILTYGKWGFDVVEQDEEREKKKKNKKNKKEEDDERRGERGRANGGEKAECKKAGVITLPAVLCIPVKHTKHGDKQRGSVRHRLSLRRCRCDIAPQPTCSSPSHSPGP